MALRDDALPQMWILNQVYVLGAQPELDAAALDAELDRHLGDLPHRRATVEDDATGRRLVEGMQERGYRAERLGVMLLGDPPPAPAPGIAREEADDDRFRAVELTLAMESREQPLDLAEKLVAGRARLRAARPGTRTFLGSRDGVDACTVTLYADGRIAQIEDVGTLLPHRGRGLASATLSLAVHEALSTGHDLVFLYVDADEGPVPLYERLGFRTAAQLWTFTRSG
jgi:GNAT superfamily N-acetyltransferase